MCCEEEGGETCEKNCGETCGDSMAGNLCAENGVVKESRDRLKRGWGESVTGLWIQRRVGVQGLQTLHIGDVSANELAALHHLDNFCNTPSCFLSLSSEMDSWLN